MSGHPGADTGGALPLYKEVKRLLTQSLADGEWQPGVALPPNCSNNPS